MGQKHPLGLRDGIIKAKDFVQWVAIPLAAGVYLVLVLGAAVGEVRLRDAARQSGLVLLWTLLTGLGRGFIVAATLILCGAAVACQRESKAHNAQANAGTTPASTAAMQPG